MLSSSSTMLPPGDAKLIAILNLTAAQLNRYFSLTVFLFGSIGNILNILVLSQRSLRTSPCVSYFLASSIANLVSILSGLTTRILSSWEADITDRVGWCCKLRAFVMFTSRTTAFWLIVLATIDRWLLSCPQYHRRRMSNLPNAQRSMMIITIISIILYSQMLYCYDTNLNDAPLKCYGKTAVCRLLTDLTYACFTIFLPIPLMIIFGCMTISNIRRTRTCIPPIGVIVEQSRQNSIPSYNSAQKRRWRKIDRHLRHMLLLQVVVLTVLTLPQAIQKLYSTITLHQHKSALQHTTDKFLYNTVLLLTYVASGMPFYIYTLTGGSIFRRVLMKLINKFLRQCRSSSVEQDDRFNNPSATTRSTVCRSIPSDKVPTTTFADKIIVHHYSF